MIEPRIDIEHCLEVDERYRRSLNYEAVDRPPLVVQPPFGGTLVLPEPWNEFGHYSYAETFVNPSAMMQNMLLDRVVPGVILGDDSPLCIRGNHGTVQIGSLLGGRWKLHEDNYPWIESFGSLEVIEKIACSDELSTDGSVMPVSLDTLKFYRERLAQYPLCAKAIQISMPDLQGPMDNAELLWGSGIYYAFSDCPDLLEKLLSRIVDVMISVSGEYREFTHDRLDPHANTQHGYFIPGRLMIRNDSSIMLSPDVYSRFISPHDGRLLDAMGTGSIHFCGNGRHLVPEMLKIDSLRGLDLGEAHLMDCSEVFSLCRNHRVAVTNLRPSRDDIVSGTALDAFPTGVVFVYCTESIVDAEEVMAAYHSLNRKD